MQTALFIPLVQKWSDHLHIFNRETSKSAVRDRVERAAAINSTQALVSALAANADRAAKVLQQKTSALDISKDALEMR